MSRLARRWLSGDERTIGLLLAVGLLTMAFFRLDRLRRDLGVPGPAAGMAVVVVASALAWWSLLPRGFVWLEPAVLTWRDFDGDRSRVIAQRLVAGWVFRLLALGYLVALLAALAAAPVVWTLAWAAVVMGAGLLALGVARHPAGDSLGPARLAERAADSAGADGGLGSDMAGRGSDSPAADRGEVSDGAGSVSAVADGGSGAASGRGGTGSAADGVSWGVGGAGPASAVAHGEACAGSAVPGGGLAADSGGAGSAAVGRGSGSAGSGSGGTGPLGRGSGSAAVGGGLGRRVFAVGFSRDLVERAVLFLLALAAVVVVPGPLVLFFLAGGMVVGAVPLLVGSGAPGRPRVARAGRRRLVDGWRDRVLRTSGLQFLDLGLLLPAARPVGTAASLRRHLNLAWVGVRGRARHLPTAGLLALAAAAVRLGFPHLSQAAVFGLAGYLAMVPLAGGLGELWRSPGRRRWVVRSDIGLRADHLLVLTGLAASWAAAAVAFAAVGGQPWGATVLLTVPLMAACAVRTVSRPLPTYDNLGQVDTPFGAMPVRLIFQTLRGPDVGVLAVALLGVLPLYGGAVVIALVVAFCVLR